MKVCLDFEDDDNDEHHDNDSDDVDDNDNFFVVRKGKIIKRHPVLES